jgi:hypothetical protein
MTAPLRYQRPIDVLRNLPAKIEAEKSFLGSVFLDNGVLDREILTPEDFRLESHRRIYMTMLELWEDRIPIDPVILSDRLEKKDWSWHTGGFEYLDELSIVVPTAANASHYARILKEQTALRKAKILNAQHAQAIEEGDLEKISTIQQKIGEIAVIRGEDGFKPLDIRMCISTPPPPQEYVVGHLPDELGIFGILIGPDGSRKSWLALHIALAVAGGRPVALAPDGKALWSAPKSGKVLYLTLEDSESVLWRRIWDIGLVPGYGWIGEAANNLCILPVPSCDIVSVDSGGIPEPTSNVNRIIREGKGARLIIIDPLAEVLDASENDDRAAKCLVQTLRRISRETGAAVLGVHHQNKTGMMNGEKHAQSSRGSSKIPAGSRWTIVLQPGEDPDWTCVTEGKASYARRDSEKWLHVLRIDDGTGREIASVPVAEDAPDEKPVVVTRGGRLKYPEGGKNVVPDPDDDWG